MFDEMPYLKLLLVKAWSHLAMSKTVMVLAASFAYVWQVILNLAVPEPQYAVGITMLVLIDLLSGVYKTRKRGLAEDHPWSWPRFWDGFLGKPIGYGLSIGAVTIVANMVPNGLVHFLEAAFISAIALKDPPDSSISRRRASSAAVHGWYAFG